MINLKRKSNMSKVRFHSLTPGCFLYDPKLQMMVVVYSVNKLKHSIRVGLGDDWYKDIDFNSDNIDDIILPLDIAEEDLIEWGFKKDTMKTNERYQDPDIINFVSPDGRLIIREDTQYMYGNRGDAEWGMHLDSSSFSTIASGDVQYIHEIQAICNAVNYDTTDLFKLL